MRQQYSQWLRCLGTAFLPTGKNTEIGLLYGSLNMLPCHAPERIAFFFYDNPQIWELTSVGEMIMPIWEARLQQCFWKFGILSIKVNILWLLFYATVLIINIMYSCVCHFSTGARSLAFLAGPEGLLLFSFCKWLKPVIIILCSTSATWWPQMTKTWSEEFGKSLECPSYTFITTSKYPATVNVTTIISALQGASGYNGPSTPLTFSKQIPQIKHSWM